MADKKYFTVGRSAKSGVFTTRSSSGSSTYVMDEKVFDKALKRANVRLLSVTRDPNTGRFVDSDREDRKGGKKVG